MEKQDKELDTLLNELLLETARQLLQKVKGGDDLRAAIDFLKFHRHNRPDGEQISSKKDPSSILEGLVEELGLDQVKGATRR